MILEGGDLMQINIFDKLKAYNADELFYREYYEKRKDKQQLSDFLSKIGYDEIIRRGLLVSEVNDDFLKPFEMGEGIFDTKGTQNICLSKHNRYTPEFLHSHTFFEMIYVFSGTCTHTISGKSEQMSSGTFCIVAPSIYHSLGVFDDSIVLNILMRTSTLEELYSTLLKNDNPVSIFLLNGIFLQKHAAYLQFQLEQENDLQQLILEMYQEQWNNGNYSEEIINNLMMIFLYRLVRSSGTTAVLSKSLFSIF